MSTETQNLLADIRQFCTRRNIEPATFGLRAVNDGKFVRRLEQGGTCTLKTLEKARRYINQQSH